MENKKVKITDIMHKKEVMELFGISSTTVNNWQLKKWLRPISIGQKIYYKTYVLQC